MTQQAGPISAEHFERVMAALMEQGETRHVEMRKELQQAVEAGVVSGLKAAGKDHELVRAFWSAGYEQMSKRARDEVSQSVGKRVMTWAAGVLFALALYVAVKAGLIK